MNKCCKIIVWFDLEYLGSVACWGTGFDGQREAKYCESFWDLSRSRETRYQILRGIISGLIAVCFPVFA